MVAQATTSPNFASPQGEGFPPSPEVDTNLKTPPLRPQKSPLTPAQGLKVKGVRGDAKAAESRSWGFLRRSRREFIHRSL